MHWLGASFRFPSDLQKGFVEVWLIKLSVVALRVAGEENYLVVLDGIVPLFQMTDWLDFYSTDLVYIKTELMVLSTPSSSQLLSCTQNPPASSSAVARTVGMCRYSYFIFLKTLLTTTLISALGAAFLPYPSHLKMGACSKLACTCLLVRSSSQLLSCLQVVLNRPETPTNESLSNLAVPYTLTSLIPCCSF